MPGALTQARKARRPQAVIRQPDPAPRATRMKFPLCDTRATFRSPRVRRRLQTFRASCGFAFHELDTCARLQRVYRRRNARCAQTDQLPPPKRTLSASVVSTSGTTKSYFAFQAWCRKLSACLAASWQVVSDAVVQGELEGWRAVGALCADGADRPVIRPRPSRQLGARSPQSRFRQYAVYPLGTDATACRSRRRLLCDLRHDPSRCDFVSAAGTAATSSVRCSICRALQFRSRCLYCATPRAIPIARSPARLTLRSLLPFDIAALRRRRCLQD